MKRRIKTWLVFLLALYFLLPVEAFAVPADKTPRKYTQSDGSVITVIHKGDEFFDYYTDTENRLVEMDDKGDWQYVTRDGYDELSSLNAEGRDLRTAFRMSLPDPVTPESIKGTGKSADISA